MANGHARPHADRIIRRDRPEGRRHGQDTRLAGGGPETAGEEGTPRGRDGGHLRSVRMATQTKKATVPARKSARATFSMPDTPALSQQRGQAPEDVVEGVAEEDEKVQEGEQEDQPEGHHRWSPGPSPPQYRTR